MRWYKEWFSHSRVGLKVQAAREDEENVICILHSEWKWRKTRNAFLILQCRCQMCGTTKKLEVHHIKSWHLFPALRFVFTNLITLCRACHFRFGHFLNWKGQNPDVEELCVCVQKMNTTVVWSEEL